MGELDTLTGSALTQIRDAGTLPELDIVEVREDSMFLEARR